MNGFPLLSVLTFLPLAGAVAVWLLGAGDRTRARTVALASALLTLVGAGFLWRAFDPAVTGVQFTERHDWMPSLGAQYFVGVDGLGVLMVLLTALVIPMAVVVAWEVTENAAAYFALVLLLESGLIGTFTALSFLHWFVYWEFCLIPAFFLIKLWGGPRRGAAATQFFVYTMVGSVALLLAFLAVYLAVGSFDFLDLAAKGRSGELARALTAKLTLPAWTGIEQRHLPVVVFGLAFLGFAVKVPVIPFHTWLPTTYAEAPTGVTMLLTGLLSKMGVYGLLRLVLPIFPDQIRVVLTPLLWLSVATIVLSAFAAFAQRDLKRVFAYSSINHLGYCVLGIFAAAAATPADAAWDTEKAAALNGVLLQLFNHGLTAAILFAGLAFLEQRAAGARGIDDFGGLRRVAPIFCGLFGIAVFASLGLPGLNGFVGEFLIFKGVFPLATWAAALAAIGLLITAVFLLTVLQRVFNGPLNEKWARLPDLSTRERLLLAPAAALMLLLGLCPQLLIGHFNPTVMRLVEHLKF